MRVRVAASSANLGPGFDCVGLALGLYDTYDLTVTDGGVHVSVVGEGASQVPRDESHLVVASIRHGLDEWGVAMPGIALSCHNAIPHSRGLGSSAAAIVGGLALAWGIAFPDRGLDRGELLRLSSLMEGHPDNAGAAVYGGALLAWTIDGVTDMVTLDVSSDIAFRVYVPDFETPTAGARKVLPDDVPRADAVVQAARAALLMHALTTSPGRLLVATQDRLHQDYRAGLMRPAHDLMQFLRSEGVPAVISGAGPCVLALGTPSQLAPAGPAEGFRVLDLPVGDAVSFR